jgi:hypothetical protein
MPPAISVTFVLAPDEYAGATRQAILRQPGYIVVGSAAALVMLSPLLLLAGVSMSPYVALGCFVGGAAFLYFLFGSGPREVYRKLNPATRDLEQSFRFTEEGIEARLQTGEAKLDWKTWMKFRETDRFFLLYPAQEMVTVLPKRAFTGAAEIDSFRELLKRKFGPA